MNIDTILKELDFAINSIEEVLPSVNKRETYERDNLIKSSEKLKRLTSLLPDFVKFQQDLKQIEAEYNGPAVSGYDSKKIGRIEEAELDRVEPMPEIEKIIIQEFEPLIDSMETLPVSSIEKIKLLRVKIINRIREKITGRTSATLPLLNVHAVVNCWLGWNNLGKERLLQDSLFIPGYLDQHQFEHLKETLDATDWNFDTLFHRLQEDAKGAFVCYLMANYRGISKETIEKFYMPKTD